MESVENDDISTSDLRWGGKVVGLGGFDFFCEPGLFKTPGSLIQIIGLITCLSRGNRTPKLRNSDFEASWSQGLRVSNGM
jgi:hypothetical protein